MTNKVIVVAVALVAVLADQIAKIAVLSRSDQLAADSEPLTPFLDLTLRWNRGISFSLFARDSASARRARTGRSGLLGRQKSRASPRLTSFAGGRSRRDLDHRAGERYRGGRLDFGRAQGIRLQPQDSLELLQLTRVELEPSLVEPADPLGVVLFPQVDDETALISMREAHLQPLAWRAAPDRRKNCPTRHQAFSAIEIQCQHN